MPQFSFSEVSLGLWASKTTHAAVELKIPDLLADGAKTVEQLAEQTRAHAPSLRRLLRALAGIGIVEHLEPDRFVLAEMGSSLLTDAPGTERKMAHIRCAPEFWRSWGELVSSIRSGVSGWQLAHGMPWVEYYQQHHDQWTMFNKVMTQYTLEVAPRIVEGYDFSRFETIVDVGRGDGTLLTEILRAHPRLKGTVLDLPELVDPASATLAAAGIADRGQAVGGDFFAHVPGGADAYLLKYILHDWPDEQAVTILRNCRTALPPHGRALIIEKILPERATPADGHEFLFDMMMLVVIGGKERTESEFRRLLVEAGLTLEAIGEPIPPFNQRILEATPA